LNLRHDLVKSFLGVGSMYMLSIPVGLLTSIVLARTLGPAAFGQYAFLMSLLALLVLPVVGGLPQLLTREVAGFVQSKQWSLYCGAVRAAHIWVLLLAALVLVGYWITGPLIGLIPQSGKWALLTIVVILVPLQGLNAVRNGTIKGLGFPALAELPMQIVQPLLLLAAVGSLAALSTVTVANALWAQVGVTILSFVLASILFYRVRPNMSLKQVPEYRNKVWMLALLPFGVAAFVGSFNGQIGTILLGVFGTDEGVAALRVAERGGQLVLLSLTLVNMVISPHIVRAYQKGDMASLQKLSQKSARYAFLIGLPIGLVLVGFGKVIIGLAFGAEYSEVAYLPMVVLVAGYLFHLMAGSAGVLLLMTGYEKLTLRAQCLGLIVMVVLSLILIPSLQALGAAIATTGGVIVYTVAQALSVAQRLNIRPGVF